MTDEIHSCIYHCTRPACVLAQRDEMRKRLEAAERDQAICDENALRWLLERDTARAESYALHTAATRAAIAMAHVAAHHPLYRSAYDALSEALDAHRDAIAAEGQK